MGPDEFDLRNAPRKPFRCPAWVTVGTQIRTCQLVDLSEAGAGLKFDKPNPLPSTFTLHLVNGQHLSLICYLAWQNGSDVGVAFEKPEPEPVNRPRFERVI